MLHCVDRQAGRQAEIQDFMAERKANFYLDSLHTKVIRLPKSNGTNKKFRDFRFRPAASNTLSQGLAEPFGSFH